MATEPLWLRMHVGPTVEDGHAISACTNPTHWVPVEVRIVGERYIEWRDEYGGYSQTVLDYEPDPKRVRRYFVGEVSE